MRSAKFLAAAAAASILCAAAEPVRLQPSSKWVLDYDDDSCRLIRTFGEGKSKTVLLFESAAPGDISMVAIGRPLSAPQTAEQIPTRFVPVQHDTFKGNPAMSADDGKSAVLWTHVPFVDIIDGREVIPVAARTRAALSSGHVRPPALDLATKSAINAERDEFVSKITAVEIEPRRAHKLFLEIGSLSEPIKMFELCGRDQLSGWGIDPDIDTKVVKRVWAVNPATWLTADDYPRSAIFKEQDSAVSARLLIDADGRVTKCTALSHVDAPDFQDVVCRALKSRARFEPAELADGTKVASYYVYTARFQVR